MQDPRMVKLAFEKWEKDKVVGMGNILGIWENTENSGKAQK